MNKTIKILSAKEIAEFLKVPVSTVYAWTSGNRIPYIKIGKHLRFNLEEVLDFFRERTKIKQHTCHSKQLEVNAKLHNVLRSLKTRNTGRADCSRKE